MAQGRSGTPPEQGVELTALTLQFENEIRREIQKIAGNLHREELLAHETIPGSGDQGQR
jgi:hypothetical protein